MLVFIGRAKLVMIGGANGERKEAKMDHGACRSLCVRYGISAALPQALGDGTALRAVA